MTYGDIIIVCAWKLVCEWYELIFLYCFRWLTSTHIIDDDDHLICHIEPIVCQMCESTITIELIEQYKSFSFSFHFIQNGVYIEFVRLFRDQSNEIRFVDVNVEKELNDNIVSVSLP